MGDDLRLFNSLTAGRIWRLLPYLAQIEDMGDPHPQFTLFVSRDDKALAFSRRVWGNIPRQGSIDPETAPYKAELADYKISEIDLTKIKVSDDLNHSKFAESPEVVQLIGARLSEGQTLTDSRVGLGDTILAGTTEVAAAAGSAAGLVLTAPVAVFDADTRGNDANHVGGLTGQVSGRQKVAVKNCAAMPTAPACLTQR